MRKLLNNMWPKVAAVAVTGGTAAALFGGPVVHTQFSATQSGKISANGANVALSLNANSTGQGNFSCSGLVPGATPSQPWYGGGYCTDTLVISNTGNTTELMAINYADPASGTSSSLGPLDLGYLNFSYTLAGATSGPFAYYPIGDAYSFGAVGPGQSVTVTLTMTLSDMAGNDWDNANIVVPYTVTATAGSGSTLVSQFDGTYGPQYYKSLTAIPDGFTPSSLGANGSATFTTTVQTSGPAAFWSDNGQNAGLIIAGLRQATGDTGPTLDQNQEGLIYAQDNTNTGTDKVAGFCANDQFSTTPQYEGGATFVFGTADSCLTHSPTVGSTVTYTTTVNQVGHVTLTVNFGGTSLAGFNNGGSTTATYTTNVNANDTFYPALYLEPGTQYGQFTVTNTSFTES